VYHLAADEVRYPRGGVFGLPGISVRLARNRRSGSVGIGVRDPPESAFDLPRIQQYGLYDLERLERMVLQSIAQEYFELDPNGGKEGDDDGEG
jgi:hypothetical protein